LPTLTRTVLFTDQSGFTEEVARLDREGVLRLIAEHEAIVRPVVASHDGVVVKNLGDSFLCLFDSATEAVRAATEILEAVHQRGGGWVLRIGLATGDVEAVDGDVFGDPVNLASRILHQAPPGEAWFAPATRACMNASEVAWEPAAAVTLRGVPGLVDLSRLVASHQAMLPDPVLSAARKGSLLRLRAGESIPHLPITATVLLEGFAQLDDALHAAVDAVGLPEPAQVWWAVRTVAPGDRHAWTSAGRGLVVGTPESIDRALQRAAGDGTRTARSTGGGDTLVFDVAATGILALAGLALPAMPMGDLVVGYAYDLAPDGRWMNRVEQPLARIDVSADGVRLTLLRQGGLVGGRAVSVDAPQPLHDGITAEIDGVVYRYRALRGAYVGVLLSVSNQRVPLSLGQTLEIGREPEHPGFLLADRRGEAQLRWAAGPNAARARERAFTLDRALAGRHQCALHASVDGHVLVSRHDKCATWLLPEGASQVVRVQQEVSVELGDLVLVGTWALVLLDMDA
jgi:hypothetical protein